MHGSPGLAATAKRAGCVWMGKLLVTGAAGYLGAHCVAAASAAGHEVAGLDLRAMPQGVAQKLGYQGDLCDESFTRAALRNFAPEIVIHCAGRMDDGAPSALHRSNIGAVLNLLNAMCESGARALVLSSTGEIYAPGASAPIREEAAIAPQSAFAWSRMVAEQIVRECAERLGLRYAILRAFHLVGAERSLRAISAPNHRSAPLTAMLRAMAEGRAYALAGVYHPTRDGSVEHDLLYVHDAALAHVRAAAHLLEGGGDLICNLGRGRGVTEKELAILLRRVSGAAPTLVEGAAWGNSNPRAIACVKHARKNLGWRAETGLESAVASAYAHWQAHHAFARETDLN